VQIHDRFFLDVGTPAALDQARREWQGRAVS
jgi:NDP-sugar pyrophosphorylase family protein